MNNGKVYLKQNVLVQPLFNHWYAWSGLIAPATAAMFVANSHIKLMQSFVSAPQVHVSALKNPALRGGPFINYDAGRVSDIKALLEETRRENSEMLEFASAIGGFTETLAGEATGYSLEPFYEKVPEVLKGYIELLYDLNNHPSIRFIEGLLYNSPYYKESSQSIALSLCENDERAFVLSTPILDQKTALHLNLPFRAAALDELFKMKFEPQPLRYVKEILNLNESEFALSSSFFTEEPRELSRYEADAVRIRYFGHACIFIETKGTSIMIDPLISYENKEGIRRFTYLDLPQSIDYVLITHNHQDHCVLETLLQLRHKIKNVIVPKNNGGGLVDPSLRLVLQNLGFKQVSELDEMETIRFDGGSITGLPFLGEHADLNIRTKLAHLVTLQGRSILCAADSNNLEPKLYEHIHQMVGDVDILFLGMECDGGPLSWLYGPLLTRPFARKLDQSRRLNGSDYERGMNIVNRLRPKQVYVYAMGQEPWLTHLTSIQYTPESRPIIDSDKLVQACLSRGLTSERLYGHKEILIR